MLANPFSRPRACGRVIASASICWILAIALAAFLSTLIDQVLWGPSDAGMLLTPVSAVMLGVFLRHDVRAWPILAFSGAAAILAAGSIFGLGPATAIEKVGLDVGEAVLAAGVLQRFFKNRLDIGNYWQAGALSLAALVIPAMTVSISIVTGQILIGSLPTVQDVLVSYAPRAVGLLVVLPVLLIWSSPLARRRDPGPSLTAVAAVIAGVAAVGAAAFAAPPYLQLPMLLVPLVVLVASRHGFSWGSLTLVALTLAVIAMAKVGTGWFGSDASLIGSQIFLAVASLALLAAGIAHSKREELTRALQAAEERAAEARRAKANFLSAMGHEFRTPITAVLGMVDLMSESDLSPNEKGYLETIRTSGRHLLAMFNDLLDYSRSETGRLCINSVDFSIREVLDQVRSFSMPQVSDLGLDFYFEVEENLPEVVRGDPKRLRQVLLNLVGNALKFTNRGSVTVRVRHKLARDSAVELFVEVVDTGVGMSAQKVADLFQSFDLHGTSTKRSHGGIGLGLAISKRLIEAMGGQIGVTSTRGIGSCFWFQVTLELGSAPDAAPLDATAMPPLRVLVVDDGAVNRKLVSQMLGRYGHQVTAARNGVEAVEMMVRGRFEMVLMDVQMPVMDGIEATRLIRDLPDPRNKVPVLGLTASILPEEYQRCRDAGMNDVLVKPVEWEQLFGAIAEHHAARADHPTLRV
ncbi:ATP-binding protein [Geminicoccus roseus]|uniref:ATP-binding protein n=1 Tax=Geminicoccus roseus TaxID=404900 RepID=UPI00040DB53A|nr:ATP-binding protein [Geminicoccus roseus]